MEAVKTIKGYELRERIGSGGFGVVHRAFQSTLGREVAIKIILPHFANHPDFIRRFDNEAQLIARLEHLHIVPLYDYWRDPDGAYLVMRWLRGGNLRDALQRGPLELEAAVLLMEQVASALAMAHRNGVIHRDLKPANILLDEDENAYLSDFGIAKDLRDSAVSHTGIDVILGSPEYLAPEQARSDPVTPQTDIYSLGVVLYEILTGRYPFPGKTPVERMYQHLSDPLPPVTNLPDEISETVNAIIRKSTAMDPAQRYSDVLEMTAAFRELTAQNAVLHGESLLEQLTLREHEILQLVIQGRTNRQIADQLFITHGTVKWYITQVYRKLRVRSRKQAILRARELNLVVSVASNQAEGVPTETTFVPLPEPENPYKGLRAFRVTDAPDFFGREKLVEKLLVRLRETSELARFLAVVGPSGSGKSSVVKAGLIPALWRGDLPGSERWFIVEVVPGPRPLDELEVALTRLATQKSGNLREQLERDKNGLLRVAGLILPEDGSELAIVIDQFEEIFTLVEDEAMRTHFLDLIYTAVTDRRSRVRVIVTLRADFYDRPLHYPEFGELMRNRMETVLPLSAKELEAAIIKPAERVGVSFESGLVATITSEVHYQPGSLPLLQYALTELFEQRDGRTLTRAAYEVLGGAVGALAKRADDLYLEHDEIGRDAIRQLFLRLVNLGEDFEDTRRRVLRAELIAIASDEDLMDDIIETFAAYRLLTLDHDPTTRKPIVEVAHEAILREWKRLRTWLDESRHDIRQQRLLAVAAAEWLEADRDSSYLLRGSRLEQFEGWAAETQLALTQEERGFLDTSLAEHEHQADVERERYQRELETQRQLAKQQQQAANRLRYLVAGLTVFLAITMGLAVFAFDRQNRERDARNKAEREADVNHSLALAANAEQVFETGHTDLALALALEAVNLDQPPPEAVRTLRNVALGPGVRAVIQGHNAAVTAISFSPDGSLALSGSCGRLDSSGICTAGELALWDVATTTELRRFGGALPDGHSDWINDVVFSPDGSTALSASQDGTIILWDAATGAFLHRFEGHSGPVNSVAFHPDGTTFISGSTDATLILWDVQTGEARRHFEGHTDVVNTVDFSPDGEKIVSSSADTTLILWQAATGEILHRFEDGQNVIGGAFLPDGISLVSASDRLRRWNLEAGQEEEAFGKIFVFRCFAISPDGRTAITAVGLAFELWDIEAAQVVNHLVSPSSIVTVAISPRGDLAISANEDGTLRLWNLGDQVLRHFDLAGTEFSEVAINPEAQQLLVGLLSGEAVLFDMKTGAVLQRFPALEGSMTDKVTGVAFLPDGTQALIGNGRNLVLWDLETGTEICRVEVPAPGFRSLAISPNGHTVLYGTQDAWNPNAVGDLFLWDIETDERRTFDHTGDIANITFSADGSRALTASPWGRNVTLWNVATGAQIQRFEAAAPDQAEGFVRVAFGPDETTIIASTAITGDLVLWDAKSATVLRRFAGHKGVTWGMEVSPDGRYVVSGDFYGQIVLWDLETGQELKRFSVPALVWSVTFGPDGTTVFSSSYDGMLREWQIADWPLDQMVNWAYAHRYIREFSCEERALYRIEPLCE